MAIEQADFELILQLRSQAQSCSSELSSEPISKQKHDSQADRLAILGDCHFHYPQGETNAQSQALFCQQTGFAQLDTFDINGQPTHQVNLNEPLADRFTNGYDWVIDSGTLYCCFDIATAWRNILNMVKPQGVVMHTSNLVGFFGRGFYSLSPALFYEFYLANGFEIEVMATRTRTHGTAWTPIQPGHTYLQHADDRLVQFTDQSRVAYTPQVPNDALLCCVARKVKEVPFTKPVPQHFVTTQGR